MITHIEEIKKENEMIFRKVLREECRNGGPFQKVTYAIKFLTGPETFNTFYPWF